MATEVELHRIRERMWKYSLGRDGDNDSDHFLRIKIPGGIISLDRLRGIAELSEKYGRGYVEITTRQDIQLHWIEAEDALEIFAEMEKLGFTTDLCGQAFAETCHGDVRNVVCCPLSGKKGYDAYWLVREITDFFSGNPDYIAVERRGVCSACWWRAGGFEARSQEGEELGNRCLRGGCLRFCQDGHRHISGLQS